MTPDEPDPHDLPGFDRALGVDDPVPDSEYGDQGYQPERDAAGGSQVPIDDLHEPRPQIEAEMVGGRPVIPLKETVAFANEHYTHFQSALDMLGRMYDSVDTDANYRPN